MEESDCQICCEAQVQLECAGCQLGCCAGCLKEWTLEQILTSFDFTHVRCHHNGCDQRLTLAQIQAVLTPA